LYWLTNNGELWRENEKGVINPLIIKEQDMTDAVQDTLGVGEPFSYVKGKVTNFYLSPDDKYIAYETLEKYTGCCGNTSDIPLTQLRIMKSDGTNKVTVAKPSTVNRELGFFDGWLPDSKRILFHFAAPDEATQGSPFFEVGLDGKNPKKFTAVYYQEFGNTITVAGTAPIFSPDGRRIAYIEGGVVGEGKVTISSFDGKTIKTVISQGFQVGDLEWSSDGTRLLVQNSNQLFIFNKDGDEIYRTDFPQAETVKGVMSPDSKYLGVGVRNKGEKNGILFLINLDTNERKETELSRDESVEVVTVSPQFFSETNRLYYLVKPKSSSSQLWVLDINTWRNYKVVDSIYQLKEVPYPLIHWKTFTNPDYNYTLKYPPSYVTDYISPSYVTISVPRNPKDLHGEVLFLIRANIKEYHVEQDIPPQPFADFAIEKLKLECFADGPNGSHHCDNVIKNIPITNSEGVDGVEIYLRQVNEWASGITDYQTKGPMFAFDISGSNSEKPEALLLDAGYGFPNEAEEEVLRQMVDTLEIN
jgi:Tol biopolymer transport system component